MSDTISSGSAEGILAGIGRRLAGTVARVRGFVVPALRPIFSVCPDTRALEQAVLDAVEFEVQSRPEMIGLIRSRVVDYARTLPFTNEEIEDIRLAVGEAGSNAVQHGTAGDCRVGIRMEKRPDCLAVIISDRGCGFDPDAVSVPGPSELAENGRGIGFMRALMDEVNFYPGRPGTTVELVKRVRVPPA